MNSSFTLWSTFFDICRLRLKPQDLPYSNAFLSLIILAYIVISILQALLLHYPIIKALLSTLVDTGLFVILISSLLFFANKSSRIIQTLTALAGANCILGIISLPLMAWLGFFEGDMSIPILLFVILMVWNMFIYAHVIQHALTIHFFFSVLLTILIFFLNFTVMSQLFPLAK